MHFRIPKRRRRGAPRPRSSAGFTLVELMVALVVLAIGIQVVGRMVVFAQRHATHGREETMAVSLAEEVREKIMSDNFDDLISIFDAMDTDNLASIPTPCQDWADHVLAGLGPGGRATVEVMDENEDPEIVTGMVSVLVTMYWQEGAVTKSLDVRFAVSKMGQ